MLSADPRQLDVLAAELVRLRVDVLVASVTPVIAAAKRATTTIPIVMANAADPVASGFVVGLARPGGNVTGVSRLVPEVIGKQLELLAGAVPGIARIGVLSNPDNPLHAHMLSRARREAVTLSVELEIGEASAPNRLGALQPHTRRRGIGPRRRDVFSQSFAARQSTGPDPTPIYVREHRTCRGGRADVVFGEQSRELPARRVLRR